MSAEAVAIVGAGAAGLLAAIRAGERGRRVVLLERNAKPGVKILISGGTRCNVTHDGSSEEVLKAFGRRAARFLRPSLLAFGPRRMMHLLEVAGVPLKTEAPHGKVFPRSDRAADVLRALVGEARARGVELRRDARVVSVTRIGEGFALGLEGAGQVLAARVVVATGGLSYPRAGFTGDGFSIARALGHAVVAPRPALVPLVLARPLADAAGVALEDARVGLAARGGGRVVASRAGELLFTHRGLSGPAALDLSGELTARTSGVVRGDDGARDFEVVLDLLPGVPHEALSEELSSRERGRGGRLASSVLHERALPRALARALLGLAGVPEVRTVQELRREERTALVRCVKDLRLAAEGTLGFDKAEVTAGGVALDEVDPATVESRRVKGLFFAGEVLDVDGPIGGYNFQAAWSTGYAAGSAV